MFKSLTTAVLHTVLVAMTYGVCQSSKLELLEALMVTFVVAMLLCIPASIAIFGFRPGQGQNCRDRYDDGAGGAAFLWILLLTTAAWTAFLGVSVSTYPLRTIGFVLIMCGAVVLTLSSELRRWWAR